MFVYLDISPSMHVGEGLRNSFWVEGGVWVRSGGDVCGRCGVFVDGFVVGLGFEGAFDPGEVFADGDIGVRSGDMMASPFVP